MRHVSALLTRELAAYFLGPMAYLVLLAFQFIAFLNFWELVDTLSEPQREFSSLRDPMSTYISGSPAFWIAILVAVPMLTMRLLAEERRSGTIETLLTVPVTETEVVLAKWLARRGDVLRVARAVRPVLPFLYYQAKFDFDIGPLLTLGLGLTTMGMMFVAIGLFLSSLTRNQIIAAIWTFVVLFLMVVIVPAGVSLRGAAARRLGRRRPVRGRALPDAELRPGPARPALPRASSFGLRFHALLDREGAGDAHEPVSGMKPSGGPGWR